MLDEKLIRMLRCPVERCPLALADPELIAATNEAIKNSQARDRLDQTVASPIDGGLCNPDKTWLYPIREGIPTLVADEAIAISDL